MMLENDNFLRTYASRLSHDIFSPEYRKIAGCVLHYFKENGIIPFQQIQVKPMDATQLRPEYKTVDELRKYTVEPTIGHMPSAKQISPDVKNPSAFFFSTRSVSLDVIGFNLIFAPSKKKPALGWLWNGNY